MITLQQLPTLKKPRERLLHAGLSSLTLEELLAVILGTGGGLGVMQLSYQVAQQLRTGAISVTSLTSLPGIGTAKATEILAALQLAPTLEQYRATQVLSSPQAIFASCTDLLELTQEQLVVFYVNVRNLQLKRETISLGTATASLVHAREVFRAAILENAAHIILAHNHPSGDPAASLADLQITRQLAISGQQLGITLLDHVICAKTGFLSLKLDRPDLFC